MSICMYVGVHMSKYRGLRLVSGVFLHCSPPSILSLGLSLTPELSVLSSLASLLVTWRPYLCLLCSGITGSCHTCPDFYMGSGALNLSLHDCVASILLSDLTSLHTVCTFLCHFISHNFYVSLRSRTACKYNLKGEYNSPLSGQRVKV